MGKFNKVMWESNSDLWYTPQEFYDELDKEFHFTLDPCSTDENAKCKIHFTIKENGLLQDWKGHNVFCNPPYSQIKEWVEKCYSEGQKNNTTVVLLIPSRTDTRYFHDYIWKKSEIRFIKGRLKFGNSINPAPFPSMLAIWKGSKNEIL